MTLAILQNEDVLAPPPEAVGFERSGPQAILHWALAKWQRRVALLTSFQAEGLVLLDMAWRINPEVRIITLDTGRLPQETHDMIDRVRARYALEVETRFPNARALETLVRHGGPNLFYESVPSRLACCHVRKVEPLRQALAGLGAWITGLRRSQSPSRAGVRKVEKDADHGHIFKLNPLADWSWRDVETYTREHGVPRHPLYSRGYTSIGCAPCTRPIERGEDPRAGRWWWEDGAHKECGLHLAATGSTAAASRVAS